MAPRVHGTSKGTEAGKPMEGPQTLRSVEQWAGGQAERWHQAGRARSRRTLGTTAPSTVGISISPASFFPWQHPPGKENPAIPSTWLSPSLERGRREASRATRARSRAHSLPCQHPLPRHLSSDGPSAWKSSRRRKDRARQPEQTQAHPGALAIPRGGSEAQAVQGDLGGRARRSGQVSRCSGSAW